MRRRPSRLLVPPLPYWRRLLRNEEFSRPIVPRWNPWKSLERLISILQLKILLTTTVLGAVLCQAKPNSPSPSDVYSRCIRELGGSLAAPTAYPETLAGFQSYLTDSGVKAVSAAELTQPNHPEVAARLGFHHFLPPRCWWSRGAALALLVQNIAGKIHAPVHIRNWWRPAAYNADPAVGGAKNGDHPTANAVDVDYRTASDGMCAEGFLRTLDRQFPWLRLSLGLGPQTTHIGLGSRRGHREWHYAGWRSPMRTRAWMGPVSILFSEQGRRRPKRM